MFGIWVLWKETTKISLESRQKGAHCMLPIPLVISPLQYRKYDTKRVRCRISRDNQIKGFFVTVSRETCTFRNKEGINNEGNRKERDKCNEKKWNKLEKWTIFQDWIMFSINEENVKFLLMISICNKYIGVSIYNKYILKKKYVKSYDNYPINLYCLNTDEE